MYEASGDCNTDHFLVVANVRERLTVINKQIGSLMLSDLILGRYLVSELEVRTQYQVEISNRFAALENLNDSEDLNKAWENKEYIETSAE